jgi:hypothetical protein
MRTATTPLSVKDVATAVVAARGLPTTDREMLEAFKGGVSSALRNHKRRESVTSAHGVGLERAWTLVS